MLRSEEVWRRSLTDLGDMARRGTRYEAACLMLLMGVRSMLQATAGAYRVLSADDLQDKASDHVALLEHADDLARVLHSFGEEAAARTRGEIE
jgi:hypothetical protein